MLKIAAIGLLVAGAACATSDARVREPAVGTQGMVSSAHPLATEAGLRILEAGGTAFDAAVATAAALNVVEPALSGMGGYGTILVYDARQGRVRFLNPSGRMPASLNSDVFRAPTPNYEENRRGAKAVSTPGNVNAWEAMWEEYGRLEWATLFEDAIRLAEEGHVLSERGAGSIRRGFDDFPDHARAFYGRDGRPLGPGNRLVQSDLANSLRQVALEGASALHGGSIGAAIDAAMREAGGFLSLEDLTSNEAEWWEPVSITYRGYDVYVASPPANSWPALVRLGMMGQFDVEALGHNTVEFLHRYAEVTKHAFWTRLRWAGDPDVAPPPLGMLLSEEYWVHQVGMIEPDRAEPFVPPTEFTGEQHTTHFVVADRWGNVVSATQTLGNGFGSRIMAEGTGIWLNNSLAYCTFEPKGNPMDAFPGRHKLSGDAPLFVMKDGKPWIAIGTPGGHTIPQTVPQMVMSLIDFGMDIQAAIDAPRIAFVEPDVVGVDRRIPESVRELLVAMGHHVEAAGGFTNAHGLVIEYDGAGHPVRFLGGAEGGVAKGY
jgi:gamma-glutamyltranspeptidase/glutathione hydrolase